MFKVGDIVEWESVSGGVSKKKRGSIIASVPPGTNPLELKFDFYVYINKFDALSMGRSKESFIVSCEGLSPTSKRYLYWPKVSYLRKVK